MTTVWCEYAWLPPGVVVAGVVVRTEAGRITSVDTAEAPPRTDRLPGLTLPGLANTHSHAFHRMLRGRTHSGSGTFWTWREQMYRVADQLDPDGVFEAALATYTEMVAAGITRVGEFHYLHHGAGGRRYADPNATGHALIAAARAAGSAITLLDACYLTGGIGIPLSGVQLRFGDGDALDWAERVEALHTTYAGDPDVLIGAAVHSVRAVPLEQLHFVAEWAGSRCAPLHVHLSEQPQENADCVAAYGRTPAQVMHDAGVLGPRTTAVHATHPTDGDIELLGGAGTTISMCPTTERDLADGIGPARRLADAGCPIGLGSDSNAVIDLFEEARAVELDERLRTGRRGHFTPAELLRAATESGHTSLGRTDAGVIAPGAVADLITVDLTSLRTRAVGGADRDLEDLEDLAGTVVFAASAADVTPFPGRAASEPPL